MKSVLLCNITTIITGTQVFFFQDRAHSKNSSSLKLQQLHPCTVHISDGIRWPLSCFTYNLTWQARQLVHTGDDSASAKSLERLDAEKPRGEKVEGLSALTISLGSCL